MGMAQCPMKSRVNFQNFVTILLDALLPKYCIYKTSSKVHGRGKRTNMASKVNMRKHRHNKEKNKMTSSYKEERLYIISTIT
jgi:hypothetical protein